MSVLGDKCKDAGLPVFEADEENVVWARELTNTEEEIFLNIRYPQRQAQAARKTNAAKTAKAIPQWATWTQAEWATYFTANLSDLEADKVTSIALARVAIKRQNAVINALAQMVIAMRDELWPDLQNK